jgi:ribosomal-protein-alanine N-acetyltransferase
LKESIQPIEEKPADGRTNSYLLNQEETERILFRKITETDYSDWLAFFRDPSSFAHWLAERETPEIECEKWYRRQFERYETNMGGMNALIEKSSGMLIGHSGLLVQQVDGMKELEVGYSLLPRFRDKGLAREAAGKCRDFAFTHQLSASLISIISLTNKSSQHVAINNGMIATKETVYKENRVIIYRITRDAWLTGQSSSK